MLSRCPRCWSVPVKIMSKSATCSSVPEPRPAMVGPGRPGTIVLCRILSKLSKTGNLSSWEVSWQCICLIFLLWLSPWLLLSVCHSVMLSRWPLKERYGVKVKKCISPRHRLQKWHQTTNVENVLIFPGLLCLCVIVHLLQKAVVLKMEMLFGQKKRTKNADVLFFGFISKD